MLGILLFSLALFVSRDKQSWGIYRWLFIVSSLFVALADAVKLDYLIDSTLILFVWIAALVAMLRGFYVYLREL